METRPPLPPFTLETARRKARAAEDAWNSRDPQRVSLAQGSLGVDRRPHRRALRRRMARPFRDLVSLLW